MAVPSSITICRLGAADAAVLQNVADGVFDNPIDPRWCAEFFADPRHHLVVALDGELVVGFASGVHYVHPDKGPELFVNEVGVAPAYQREGLGRRVLETLLAHGRALGCQRAWLGTETHNVAANRLYHATGGEPDPEPFVLYWFELGDEDARH